MSKGSVSRPFSVTNEQYAQRWDLIFGRDNEKKNETQTPMDVDRPVASCNLGRSNNGIQGVGQTQTEGTGGN